VEAAVKDSSSVEEEQLAASHRLRRPKVNGSAQQEAEN